MKTIDYRSRSLSFNAFKLKRETRETLVSCYLGFFVIDILVFPKVLFSTPLSFFLLLPVIFLAGLIKIKYFLIYLTLFLVLLASVLNGALFIGTETVENAKRAIQILLVFLLFFLDYRRLNQYLLSGLLRSSLVFFYLYSLFFLLLLTSFPHTYEALISTIYPESRPMLVTNLLNERFSLHFTDPNSYGYLVVFSLVLCLVLNFSMTSKNVILIASAVLVASTQSRGALLALGLVFILYYLFYTSWKTKIYTIAFIAFSVLLVYAVFHSEILRYYDLFQRRAEIEEAIGAGLGGGRLRFWGYFLDNVNLNPFFGVGYYQSIDGVVYKPHSDFIRMNLAYGVFIYFIFLSFFRGFGKKYLIVWTAFIVPFLINTIIDDFRLFSMFALIFLFVKNVRFESLQYNRIETMM